MTYHIVKYQEPGHGEFSNHLLVDHQGERIMYSSVSLNNLLEDMGSRGICKEEVHPVTDETLETIRGKYAGGRFMNPVDIN